MVIDCLPQRTIGGVFIMQLKLERIYTKPVDTDGYRVLVDRLWPRGISKVNAQLDNWVK